MKKTVNTSAATLALLESLELTSVESGMHLKSTTKFDPEDGEAWHALHQLYHFAAELKKVRRASQERREQAQFSMLLATILNSALTHGRFAFVLTRDETLRLVRADKNWARHGAKFTIKNEGPWWGKFTAYLIRANQLVHLVQGGQRRGDGYKLSPLNEYLLAYEFGVSSLDEVLPSLRAQADEVIKHVQKQKRQPLTLAQTKSEPANYELRKYKTHTPDPETVKAIGERFKFGPGDDDDIL